MAITRINNNQISDSSVGNTYLGINAAAKLQNYSITATKIANSLTYGSDLVITGNLTVQGNTTTIDTVNLIVDDPLMLLAAQQTGAPAVDIGFIGQRGTSNNIAFVWQESSKQFITAFTTTGISNTTISVESYANFQTLNANVTGILTVTGATGLTGNATFGNVFVGASKTIDVGNNIITNVQTPTANSDAATKGYVDGLSGSGFIVSDGSNTQTVAGGETLFIRGTANQVSVVVGATDNVTIGLPSSVTISGNITSGNLISNALVQGVTVTASGNLNGNNATITNAVAAATGAFTGNVTTGNVSGTTVSGTTGAFSGNVLAGNVNSNAAVSGVTITASGNLNGNNATITNTVAAASGEFSGNVLAGNLNSNAAVTGVTITASGNLNGNNATITNAVAAATGAFSGNVTTGNVSGATVSGTTGAFSGNVTTGNVSGTTVSGTTGAFSGNVLAGNVNSNAAVTGVTVTATGNLAGGNANITNAVNAATGAFTGNVTTGNVSGVIVSGTTGSFTGNVSGGNINTNSIVGTAVTITSTGTLALAPTGNITVNSKNINSLADPVQAQDAATKIYVDTVAQGLDPKASVVYATSANLAAYTYDNGTSGVGATLTAQSVGNLLVNSNLVSAGQRILIKDEVGAYVNTTTQSAAFNGIYTVTTAGAVAAEYVLTRSTDFDLAAEMPSAFTFVESGGTNADTGWVCTTNSPITVGTTQIIFAQFSGAGSYTAGNALSLNGTQFNVLTDGNISVNGSNQLHIVASATLVTPNIGNATGNSLTLSGNGVLSATTVNATGNVLAGNVNSNAAVTGVTITASGNLNGNNATITNAIAAATGAFSGNVLAGNVNSNAAVTGTTGSFTGNVLAGNLNSNAAVTGVTITASGNLVGNNATITNAVTAATGSFTGNVLAGNVNSNAAVTGVTITASGNLNGNNATITNAVAAATGAFSGNVTTGNVSGTTVSGTTGSFSGNVLAGNLNSNAAVTGVTITASGNLNGNNATITNAVTAATGAFTGNVLAGNLNSNAAVTGVTITASGNLNGNNATITNAVAAATGAFTGNVTTGNVSGTTVSGTTGSFTGNVLAGNLNSNAAVTGVTITATGNITGGNISTSGKANLGNIRISGDDITGTNGIVTFNSANADVDFKFSGTSNGLLVLDAGTNTVNIGTVTPVTGAKLQIASTDSILVPVGNTTQRPTGVTGMVRFNTALDQLELYDNTTWVGVGSVYTVITADEFVGNGVQTNFTLTSNSTTAASIVAINGVVQIPTTAYSVSGNVLTFTEAPAVSDYVDARSLTTTATVTGISNAPGNAVISVTDTTANISITGNILPTANAVANIGSTTLQFNTIFASTLTATGNANVGNLGATNIVGTLTTAAQTNITSVGTLTSLAVTGNITSGNLSGTSIVGTLTTAAQTNITSVGTLTSLAVTGNITSGNVQGTTHSGTTGTFSGNVTTGNVSGTTGAFTNVGGTLTTAAQASITSVGTLTSLAVTGNITGGNLSGTSIVGTLTTAAQTNITSVGTLTSLAVTGNITSGNLSVSTGTVTVGNIVNANGNAIGNIGSSTLYFNTVFAKATSAQYADLAEMYEADQFIPSGTVVCFGGSKEITVCSEDGSRRVAGVISTNPSYIMNAGLLGDCVVAVALTGRVPCRVTGIVRKGDMMVATGDGRARAEENPATGSVIGKALADFDGADGVIEVVVGRL